MCLAEKDAQAELKDKVLTGNRRILGVRIRNVKAIKTADIQTRGENVIVVGGLNEAGKSTILDSILYTFGGKRKLPIEPLRHGTTTGYSRVTTEKLIVERKFDTKGGGLKVTPNFETDEPLKSPQDILTELIGPMEFDPMKFVDADSKGHVAMLKKLVGLDFTDVNAKRESIGEDRRLLKKEIKLKEGELAGMPQHDIPDNPLSFDEIKTKLQTAESVNSANAEERRIFERAQEKTRSLQTKISGLEKELELARAALQTAQTDEMTQREVISALCDEDTAVLVEQLGDASGIKAKQDENKKRRALQVVIDDKNDVVEDMTEQIKTIDEEKRRLVASTKMPIAGLELCDECVRYEGTPLEQCSQAQCLRVAVAVGFAMNPNLPIMLIRGASLLDANSKKVIEEIAEEYDGQVWLELATDNKDECCVFIEEGEISWDKWEGDRVDDLSALVAEIGG